MLIEIVLAATAGFALGVLVGLSLWQRARVASEREAAWLRVNLATLQKEKEVNEEKLRWVESAQEQMREAFKALASDVLRANSQSLAEEAKKDLRGLVDPLKENLTSLDHYVRELERAREGAYGSLQEQLAELRKTHTKLQETTATLTQALRSPTVRGRWGEMELRRVVEMAGMTKHVAFDEQAPTDTGRPDLIAHLPNGGVLPVDAKAPFDSYLKAAESLDEAQRKAHLESHARAMRERIRELGQKQYWDQFESTPDFVVMFVPNEACLGAAFEADAALLEYAIEKKVLICSPVTLLALLRAVAYGWQQHQVTENAIRIAQEGRELYTRLAVFADRFRELGESLNKSIDRYNRAVGSFDRRLAPAARRFEELGVSSTQLAVPEKVEAAASLPEAGGADDAPRAVRVESHE